MKRVLVIIAWMYMIAACGFPLPSASLPLAGRQDLPVAQKQSTDMGIVGHIGGPGIDTVTLAGLGAAYALAAIPARHVLERGQWAEVATLTLHPQSFAWEQFPQTEAILVFAWLKAGMRRR